MEGDVVKGVKDAAAREQRRRDAVRRVLSDGEAQVEVAEDLGVDPRTVRKWIHAFRQDGSDGLKSTVSSGRPAYLDEKQRVRLERLLLQGAKRCGFPTDLWDGKRVVELIRKTFDIEYSPKYVPRLLRSLGWTPQKPERRAIERDEEAIASWVKVEWRKIKKKRSNRKQPSSS